MDSYDIAPDPSFRSEIVGVFAASLEDGTREWLGELGDDLSAEDLARTAFPGGHSIGGILLHIALVEAWWIHSCCCGQELDEPFLRTCMASETDVDAVVWPAPPAQPFAWYRELLAGVRATSLRLLRDLDDPERVFERPSRGEAFTVRWILSHVVQHEAYHGGQAVLLKLIGDRLAS